MYGFVLTIGDCQRCSVSHTLCNFSTKSVYSPINGIMRPLCSTTSMPLHSAPCWVDIEFRTEILKYDYNSFIDGWWISLHYSISKSIHFLLSQSDDNSSLSEYGFLSFLQISIHHSHKDLAVLLFEEEFSLHYPNTQWHDSLASTLSLSSNCFENLKSSFQTLNQVDFSKR